MVDAPPAAPRAAPLGPARGSSRQTDPAPFALLVLTLGAGIALDVGVRGGAHNGVVALAIALVVGALTTSRRIERADHGLAEVGGDSGCQLRPRYPQTTGGIKRGAKPAQTPLELGPARAEGHNHVEGPASELEPLKRLVESEVERHPSHRAAAEHCAAHLRVELNGIVGDEKV